MKNFYKISLFTALLLLCSTVATAHDFVVDGIYYNITDKTAKTVEVTSDGNSYNPYRYQVMIPSSVTYNGTNYSVTSIGGRAFYNCEIYFVKIPNSVTSIEGSAFENCIYLAFVTIGDSVISIGDRAFYGCIGLTSVTIPNSVTSIGWDAFNGCTGLTSVTIGSGVKSINHGAFYSCTGLTNIVIPNSVTSIEGSAFSCTGLTSVTIGSGVKSIKNGAFYCCTGLTCVTIPNSVTSIEQHAFRGCSGLKVVINCSNLTFSKGYSDYGYVAYYADKVINAPNGSVDGDFVFDGTNTLVAYLGNGGEVTLPDNCNGKNYAIGANVFKDNTAITNITIPNNVTSIGRDAFNGCTGLKSVTIGNGVTSIGSSAFYNCSALKKVINCSNLTFAKGSTNYGYVAYYAEKVMNLSNGSIESDFVFGVIDGVNTLAAYLGNGGEVILPDSCKGENYVIGENVFSSCSGLTSVTIGNGVTSIGDDAFSGCTGLKEVRISDLVAWCNIEFEDYDSNPLYYAHNLCLNGESVTTLVVPTCVTSIGNYAFYGCSNFSNVTIPTSVTSIGNGAFRDCSKLANITLPAAVTSIGSDAFRGCTNLKTVYNFSNIKLSKSSKSNGYVAYYASTLFNAPGGSIEGDYVFTTIDGIPALSYYIGSATSLTLPANYQGGTYTIAAETFKSNTKITSITIPASVTTIGSKAFESCTSLQTITLQGHTTTIEEYAFNKCSNLTAVHTPSLEAWCSIEFANPYSNPLFYAKKLYVNNEPLTTFVVPHTITEIKNNTFYNCTTLETADLPRGLTTIGEAAFRGCSNLTTATIPNTVVTIGKYAYYDCTGLTSLTSYLPGESLSALSVDSYTFLNVNKKKCTLTVPIGSRSTYASSSGWKDFKTIVETEDTAIENITTSPARQHIFDLKGNPVTTPVKGNIYIINGRKVVL